MLGIVFPTYIYKDMIYIYWYTKVVLEIQLVRRYTNVTNIAGEWDCPICTIGLTVVAHSASHVCISTPTIIGQFTFVLITCPCGFCIWYIWQSTHWNIFVVVESLVYLAKHTLKYKLILRKECGPADPMTPFKSINVYNFCDIPQGVDLKLLFVVETFYWIPNVPATCSHYQLVHMGH